MLPNGTATESGQDQGSKGSSIWPWLAAALPMLPIGTATEPSATFIPALS